jgi:uncharacterized membrane protein (UPF0182 family)
MLYVQPFYLVAGESGTPRLQLVAVHVNGRVGYGRDLTAALRRVMGRSLPDEPTPNER